ncbi:MAG: TatD family hydrolase [Acidimicrobiales bacterium]
MRRLFGGRRKSEGEEAVDGPDAGDAAAAAPREGSTRRRGQSSVSAEPAAGELWTDSHCHLQYATDEGEARAVATRAAEAGVRTMICVGTDGPSSKEAVATAGRLTGSGSLPVEVFATIGLHPHEAASGIEEVRTLLAEASSSEGQPSRVVAVGECGLDYHYDHSPRAAQREAFAAQVGLANEHGLALVIHTRDAWSDTFSILATEGVPKRTIFHCFSGGPSESYRCLSIGAYLSFSGIVTFNNAGEIRDAARLCPSERILVETDSPYLTPVPHRGRSNEPCFVPLVGAAIAAERGVSPQEMARITSANATAAFALRSG